MIALGTAAHGRARRRAVPVRDGTVHKGEWMESGDDPSLSPTVFLVEQPPGYALPTHFHRQNEFQVFVHGEGALGRHPLGPVTVHYAGAYTGYGPLVAGDAGLHYFTMRPVMESGALYWPDARDAMVRGPKRHAQAGPVSPATPDALAALRGVACDDLIALQPDRLAVRRLRLPPGARTVDIEPAGSGGQFLMVIAGTLRHADASLSRHESLFVSADEPAPALVAGDAGLDLLLMQLPPRDPVYA